MAATTEITLNMLLTDLQRQRKEMLQQHRHIPEYEISHYEKRHRENCNETLIRLVTKAIENKRTDGPKLLQILTQQP